MLLKKLYLTNFRPFKGEHEIEFSTDSEKNVTLIMAENGAGKTTLAQAFQWVLYSKTDGFKNKSVLNSLVEKEMMLGSSAEVKVKLDLEHNGIEYTIIRKQVYKKDVNGVVKPDNTISEIFTKKEDGQTIINNSLKNISIVSNILPESLSKYFFFDGERIEKMAGEVNSGKSEEFKTAVQNILGLTALTKAIDHLNPDSKNSVIGKYNAQIDAAGDQKTRAFRDIIYSSTEKIKNNNMRIKELEEEIRYYETEIENAKMEILNYADVEKMQQELNRLNESLKREKQNKNNAVFALLNNFSKETHNYLSIQLIKEALIELKNTDNIDKGIPSVRADTIKFLMNRKKCICGTDLLDPTSEAVINLTELLRYIPPQSLGTSISEFQNASNMFIKSSETYNSNIQQQLGSVRSSSIKIDELEHDIGEIDRDILKSSNVKVKDLKDRQTTMEKTLNDFYNEKNTLIGENLYLNEKKRDSEAEISRLQMKIEKNKWLEEQILYARNVFNKFKQTYDYQEAETRESLEKQINLLFERIYEGGMTISIDEKYKITTHINALEQNSSNIDSNTAKSYSIIFAFIVGVINLAKEKVKEKADNNGIITDEYPLVMDAPLSSFDQKRIKNICEVMPNIARQVIIFIKDTDGNIARKEMSDKIGIEYEITIKNKEMQVDSKITKVGEF